MSYTDGNTEERDLRYRPGRCGAAISPHIIVMKGTDEDEVITCTAGTSYPIGITGDASEANAATYAEDDPVAIKYAGVALIKMAGAGVRDDRVMSDASGQGIRHVNTDGVYVVGHATKAWSDGDVIPVEITKFLVGDYTAS